MILGSIRTILLHIVQKGLLAARFQGLIFGREISFLMLSSCPREFGVEHQIPGFYKFLRMILTTKILGYQPACRKHRKPQLLMAREPLSRLPRGLWLDEQVNLVRKDTPLLESHCSSHNGKYLQPEPHRLFLLRWLEKCVRENLLHH